MGLLTPLQILLNTSYALVEDVVNTQVNPTGAPIVGGITTVTPGSMVGIYPTALLVCGTGGAQEIIFVISTTASTFTANFLNAHAVTDVLLGATFPSGQPDHPTYTQAGMLAYLSEAQNTFLLRVRPIYAIGTQALTVGNRIYPCPADSIRVERVSVNAVELWDATETDLDWQDSAWQTTPAQPRYWYQDKVGVQNFGVGPPPQVGNTARIFYSQRGSPSLGFLDPLLVPDVMAYALKYGVLAYAFDAASEQRDPARAAYCQKRFDFICLLAQKFMEGIGGRLKMKEEGVEPALEAMAKAGG
jgi:hypothetical protein